jgi:hypothetical protein
MALTSEQSSALAEVKNIQAKVDGTISLLKLEQLRLSKATATNKDPNTGADVTPELLAKIQSTIDLQQSLLDTSNAALATAQAKVDSLNIAQTDTQTTKEVTDAAKNTPAPANPPVATAAPAGGEDDDKGPPPTTTTASSTASKSTPNAGTTIAGTAGTSTATETNDLIGRRLFNPLSEFSSYTYKIGLYLMDPIYYNAYMDGDQSAVKNFKLIVQSGGITKGIDSERATGFDLDFYIDNLEILTYVAAKETKAASNSVDFKFKVIEPYGFTFTKLINDLQVATQSAKVDAEGKKEQIVALRQHFFIMISFYGYDKNGKLVSGDDYPQADITRSDKQAVFERGFPIAITGLKFKLEDKTVTYDIEAKMVNEIVGKGIQRGMVMNAMTISGETVEDALNGPTGLFTLLNKNEATALAKENSGIDSKLEYSSIIEKDSLIGESRLVTDKYYTKEKSLMSYVTGSVDSNVRTEWLNKLGDVDKQKREISIPANTPILQAIDTVIMQSTYIRDAMKAVEKEQYSKVQSTDSDFITKSPKRALAWWHVSPDVRINLKRDEKRNDYVYKINYNIQTYEIPYVRSLVHGYTKQYYGPHKRYEYWYTGENSEIIGYEQAYNLVYFVGASTLSQAAQIAKDKTAPSTAISNQNADETPKKDGTMNLENSIKAFLYSPVDQLTVKIKILGDPDYLMPSMAGGKIQTTDTSQGGFTGLVERFYGKDYTINPNSGQVFFEVDFLQATDYNIDQGLLDINHEIKFWNYSPELSKQVKGMTYQLIRVTSRFSKGKFEQELHAVLPPDLTTSQTGEEVARTEAAKPVSERAKIAPSLAKPDDGSYDRAEAARLAKISAAINTVQNSPYTPALNLLNNLNEQTRLRNIAIDDAARNAALPGPRVGKTTDGGRETVINKPVSTPPPRVYYLTNSPPRR